MSLWGISETSRNGTTTEEKDSQRRVEIDIKSTHLPTFVPAWKGFTLSRRHPLVLWPCAARRPLALLCRRAKCGTAPVCRSRRLDIPTGPRKGLHRPEAPFHHRQVFPLFFAGFVAGTPPQQQAAEPPSKACRCAGSWRAMESWWSVGKGGFALLLLVATAHRVKEDPRRFGFIRRCFRRESDAS
eukprot:scaffold903_cov262-Pinguiococcus_pyrenoidosus.AAC.22